MTGHGFTVWLMGLPCSGKTTIAAELSKKFSLAELPVVLLDGDVVRCNLCSDLGFSKEDRDENLRRVGSVAHILTSAGVSNIVACVTPYESQRRMIRDIFDGDARTRILMVHLNCPLRICEERDVKGMYAKARRGEITGFTGVDDPFEHPRTADLILDTASLSIPLCVGRIIDHLKNRGFIPFTW